MITFVYVVSPTDQLGETVRSGSLSMYEGRDVWVVRPPSSLLSCKVCFVVFVDGSPLELKQAIARGDDIPEALMSYQARIESMLHLVKVGLENVRVFVHFGGLDVKQCDDFSQQLNKVRLSREGGGLFEYHAMSFGRQYPRGLFKNGTFSLPNNEKELNRLFEGNFEHFRALRILLESCRPKNEEGGRLFPRCCPSFFSPEEEECLEGNECIEKTYKDWRCRSRTIFSEETWKVIKQKLSEIGG